MGLFFNIFFSIIVVILFIICAVCIFHNDGSELFDEFVDGLFEFYNAMIQDE